MPATLFKPAPRSWWLKRRNHCLQCGQSIADYRVRRWCSDECEDYWVEDCL